MELKDKETGGGLQGVPRRAVVDACYSDICREATEPSPAPGARARGIFNIYTEKRAAAAPVITTGNWKVQRNGGARRKHCAWEGG